MFPPLDYINDGVYGAFNCILFDHQKVHPCVLSMNGRGQSNHLHDGGWVGFSGDTACAEVRGERGEWVVAVGQQQRARRQGTLSEYRTVWACPHAANSHRPTNFFFDSRWFLMQAHARGRSDIRYAHNRAEWAERTSPASRNGSTRVRSSVCFAESFLPRDVCAPPIPQKSIQAPYRVHKNTCPRFAPLVFFVTRRDVDFYTEKKRKNNKTRQ